MEYIFVTYHKDKSKP